MSKRSLSGAFSYFFLGSPSWFEGGFRRQAMISIQVLTWNRIVTKLVEYFDTWYPRHPVCKYPRVNKKLNFNSQISASENISYFVCWQIKSFSSGNLPDVSNSSPVPTLRIFLDSAPLKIDPVPSTQIQDQPQRRGRTQAPKVGALASTTVLLWPPCGCLDEIILLIGMNEWIRKINMMAKEILESLQHIHSASL